MQQRQVPIAGFCVAAPSDGSWLARWETHLLPLHQNGSLTIWSERNIVPGEIRSDQVNSHLEQAQVIFLLLSADFFASEECLKIMERALERQQEDAARVIPLLIHPVLWQQSRLASLACLPSNSIPVTSWNNPEEAFQNCIQGALRILGQFTSGSPRPTGAQTLQQQNRIRMLQRLQRSYNDLMQQSLQGIAWLELRLTKMPAAVQNVSSFFFRGSRSTEQLLPSGVSIQQIYDEAAQELLILGEPGVGKSILLLHLAQQLVVRAEAEENFPLPILLPLSSWAIKRLPLRDWIIEQLTQIYYIPRSLSEQWVGGNAILPLLDGLDEVAEVSRPACVAAINDYHRDNIAPLVVCSRKTEYEHATQKQRLELQGAIVVQPLAREQVETYLLQAGEPVLGLLNAIKENESLKELTTTPLLLSILILTYKGMSVREISKRETLLPQIWSDYVKHMVEHKRYAERYPLRQTCSWLGWLAQQIRKRNQTVFSLEQMQPDWLVTNWKQRLSFCLLVAVFYGLSYFMDFAPGYILIQNLSNGLFIGLAMGISNFILFFFLNGLFYPFFELHLAHKLWYPFASALQHRLTYGLIYGVTCGALLFLIDPQIQIVSSGLYIAVAYALVDRLTLRIQPAEEITWSWRHARRQLKIMSLFGLGGGLIYVFLDLLITAVLLRQYISVVGTFFFGLTIGMSIALSAGIGRGLAHHTLIESRRRVPNQGIHTSCRNGLKLGLVSGAILGSFITLLNLLAHQFGGGSPPLIEWIGYLWALVFAVTWVVWVANGGIPWVYHYILRLMLWRAGITPWNYTHFLDSSANRLLLRKVGGSYLFKHSLLSDYFASYQAVSTVGSVQTNLPEVCAQCGSPYRSVARFCSNCGQPRQPRTV